MIIATYINNFLIYGAEKKEINKVKDGFKAKFYMSDLGPVLFYLRMAITQNCTNKIVCFGGFLTSSLQDYQTTNVFWIKYQSVVGSLMYVIPSIGPNLAFSILIVRRYASNSNLSYWQAVKRIFCDICSTQSFQLTYHETLSYLEGYSDGN